MDTATQSEKKKRKERKRRTEKEEKGNGVNESSSDGNVEHVCLYVCACNIFSCTYVCMHVDDKARN